MAVKKFTGDTIMFSYRADAEKWRVFSALATLRGETPTDIFRICVDEYLEKYKSLLGTALEGLGTTIE
jgi:hypothetical protein